MNAAAALREIAGTGTRGDRIKQVLASVARDTGLSYWRAFDIWYGKARRLEDAERVCIAEALEKKRREALRNEFQELWTRLLQIESRLAVSDPDFHRPTIDAIEHRLRGARGANCSSQ